MSVAFRRESDEEHLEPRFELPIPTGPNLVTPRGLALIAERLADLETRVGTASGDGREAAARALRYWRTRSVTATLAPPPPADEVAFGSRLRVRIKGAERLIEIVGDEQGAGRGRQPIVAVAKLAEVDASRPERALRDAAAQVAGRGRTDLPRIGQTRYAFDLEPGEYCVGFFRDGYRLAAVKRVTVEPGVTKFQLELADLAGGGVVTVVCEGPDGLCISHR